MRLTRFAATMAFILASSAASAADSLIPAERFAREPEYRSAKISPDGGYVAVISPFEKFDAVHIIKLNGNYERSVIKFDPREEEIVANIWWTGDRRLVAAKAKFYGMFNAPGLTGAIYAADADGENQKQLFGYVTDNSNFRSLLKDRATSMFMQNVPAQPGHALFRYYPWERSNSDFSSSVYRVDTVGGKRSLVETIEGGYPVADQAGTVRFRVDQTITDQPNVWVRREATGGAWTRVPETITRRWITPLRFEADNNHLYALISDAGEPEALYRVDLAAGTRQRLAGNERYAVTDVLWGGYDERPIAVLYEAGRPKIDYVDTSSPWAQLHSGLMKLFPGQLVDFRGHSKDEKKTLFFVHGDRHPGAYYLFDHETKKPAMLFETKEWIEPAKMAPTRPFEFVSSSGETLAGFFTAPAGKSGPLPTVVMPHGGPFGPYDSWGYDADVQFLASRGYAVLQVNFRGSGGRGERFQNSTYKQWGTGIQDDITDAVKWAVAQNLADPKRLCIFGASFGGYSALMNPIRNPGMYRCAVGYVGVYDLAEMHKSGDIDDNKQGRSYLDRAVGDDPAQLAAQSPAAQAAKLDLPILLVHGRSDRRAPMSQFNAMEAALKKANKPFESVVKSDEGHGFYDTSNRVEFYQRLEAFLQKHNPAN
ncbi:alpha/beta hydrolase family protein [Arenimonas sp.]|uniref:alpha/beta hydrolase family protein n=1 Tax=Arenimonas sp. TaxID=1872635 RepID=UPI0039E39067